MVKCLVLMTGTVLIGKVEEIAAELGDPNCQLTNFLEIDSNNNLQRWITFTEENKILLRSENILTIVDPSKKILKMYENFEY